MTTTIHLVRHGEVENPKGVIYGRLPGYNLSERGQRQAAAAGERLADRDVGAIWASPLERAQETAAAIAAHHEIEIVTDERLIESDTTLEGVGKSITAFMRSPKHWWALRNPWRPSWGETFLEIKLRMMAAIDDAVEAAGGRDVVIVSHQTPVLVARAALSQRRGPPWLGGAPCTTGSITSIRMDGGVFVGAEYHAPPV